MKKIYNETQLIKIGKMEACATSSLYHYFYLEEEEAKDNLFTVDRFSQLCALVEKDYIYNATMHKALFSGKNIINFWVGNCEIKITEKNFRPIKIAFVYTECKEVSLQDLMNRLPADIFLEYLKDRGFKEINF